jgi:hemoglobin-like flavoprotein
MTPESHRLVQESWTLLAADVDAVTRRFYDTLFQLAPHTRAAFTNVDLDAQRRKLAQMLDATVRMLDDPAALLPELAALGRRHVGYGIDAADYDAVGSALLVTLEESLGDAFTPRVRDAWMEAYRTIAGVMRRAAARMPNMLTGEMPVVKQP